MALSLAIKRRTISLALMLLAILPQLAFAEGIDKPTPAPAFEASDLEGKPIRLSQYKGKVVVLNFWGTWCTPCRKETPDLVAVQQQFGSKGLVVIGAAMDQGNQDGVKAFAKTYFVNYPIISASSALNHDYGVIVAPTTLIIDKSGNVVYRHIGAINRQDLAKLVSPLL
jgi:cytochrome c biogenesis protein CcmG, thiol:disulfide interchange protein DsbE